MAGKRSLSLLCLCLLVPNTLTSPVTDVLRKKHTQLAVLVVIGLDEIVTGGALMVRLTGLIGVSAAVPFQTLEYPCAGHHYRPKRHGGGWCRSRCLGHEIVVVDNICGQNKCCIPI